MKFVDTTIGRGAYTQWRRVYTFAAPKYRFSLKRPVGDMLRRWGRDCFRAVLEDAAKLAGERAATVDAFLDAAAYEIHYIGSFRRGEPLTEKGSMFNQYAGFEATENECLSRLAYIGDNELDKMLGELQLIRGSEPGKAKVLRLDIRVLFAPHFGAPDGAGAGRASKETHEYITRRDERGRFVSSKPESDAARVAKAYAASNTPFDNMRFYAQFPEIPRASMRRLLGKLRKRG